MQTTNKLQASLTTTDKKDWAVDSRTSHPRTRRIDPSPSQQPGISNKNQQQNLHEPICHSYSGTLPYPPHSHIITSSSFPPPHSHDHSPSIPYFPTNILSISSNEGVFRWDVVWKELHKHPIGRIQNPSPRSRTFTTRTKGAKTKQGQDGNSRNSILATVYFVGPCRSLSWIFAAVGLDRVGGGRDIFLEGNVVELNSLGSLCR